MIEKVYVKSKTNLMLDIDVDYCNGIKNVFVFFLTASQIIEIFNARKSHKGNVANYN